MGAGGGTGKMVFQFSTCLWIMRENEIDMPTCSKQTVLVRCNFTLYFLFLCFPNAKNKELGN